ARCCSSAASARSSGSGVPLIVGCRDPQVYRSDQSQTAPLPACGEHQYLATAAVRRGGPRCSAWAITPTDLDASVLMLDPSCILPRSLPRILPRTEQPFDRGSCHG